MSRLEYFDVIGLFLKSCAAHVNTERIGRGGEKGKNYNLKFRKTKEIFYIHCITIYHPHWKYLTSIFLYNSTLTVAMKSCKSGAQPIISLMGCSKWNLQGKTWYYSLLYVRHKRQQFHMQSKRHYLHHTWLQRETNEKNLAFIFNSPYIGKYFHFE